MTYRSRRPLSPEARAVLKAQRSLSRRSLLTGAGAAGLGVGLAACGTGGTAGTTTSGKPGAAVDKSDTDKVVKWANWTEYLDYDDKSKTFPTLEKFEQQVGIQATYSEDIEDNDSYFAKVRGQLQNGQDIGEDVIVFTDWMASRVVRLGYVQKLDKANITNAGNILDTLTNVSFDKGRNYSLTYQSGYTGLAWNKEKLKEMTGKDKMTSVDDLWDPKLKGRVEVLTEFRDTIGLILLGMGMDIENEVTPEQFGKGLEVLEKQLNDAQIRQVKGNSYTQDLKSGDAVAVMGWSGDITQINAENGDKWDFAIPDAGGVLWSDNFLIPIGSPHKKNAEILINYYYEPSVAAEVAAYVNYICPVKGAKEEILKSPDPSLASNPLIFPTDKDLERVQVFAALDPATETQFTDDFQKVLGV